MERAAYRGPLRWVLADTLNAEQVGYRQSLGRRQVQMIAIGGAIGTGLFWDRRRGCIALGRRWC